MGDGPDVATWIGVEDEQIGCGANAQPGSRLVTREPAASPPGRCPQAEEGISQLRQQADLGGNLAVGDRCLLYTSPSPRDV